MNVKRSLQGLCFLLVSLSGSHLALAETASQDKADVTQAVLAFNQAYEQNRLDDYFSYYQEGATMWINADFSTVAAYKADWYKLIESGGAVEKNILSDLKVVVSPGGDAAAAAYRLEVHTRYPDGKITRDQSQESDTWFKVNGEWKIAHLHYVTQPMP